MAMPGQDVMKVAHNRKNASCGSVRWKVRMQQLQPTTKDTRMKFRIGEGWDVHALVPGHTF